MATPFQEIVLDADGIQGPLPVTKTTGPGKMVRMERFAVGQGAYLLDEDWLKRGFEVWQTMRRAADLAETTGLLLFPTPDGQGVRAEVANYQDA
eukprot:6433353-Amphidinium_carterae.2